MNNDNPIRIALTRLILIGLLLAVSVCMLGCPVSSGHPMHNINNEIKAVKGYYLMAYGTAPDDGMDVDGDGTNDHIIEVLEGINTDTPDVPLADLL